MNEITVSIAMPAYNEIRFIEDTLRSVVNEADEIIIGDNCSTDGTSEIIAEYAKKYPHIKHFRHNQNIGSPKNYLFVIEKCKGKYIRLLGAHDLISKNSTKNMLKIFETQDDAILVYSAKCAAIDENNELINVDLGYLENKQFSAQEPFSRVLRTLHHIASPDTLLFYGVYNGMYRKDFIKNTNKYSILKMAFTDRGFISNLASLGKICGSNSTIYIRMPHKMDSINKNERYKKSLGMSIDAWNFATIVESYEAVKRVQDINGFKNNITDYCLDRLFSIFCANTFNMLELSKEIDERNFIKEEKYELAKDVLKRISEYINKNDKNGNVERYLKNTNFAQELIDFYKKNIHNKDEIKKYVLFGVGNKGYCVSLKFKELGIKLDYFCDNNDNYSSLEINGIKCLSFKELKDFSTSALIFVAIKNGDQVYEQLEKNNFKYIFPKELMEVFLH